MARETNQERALTALLNSPSITEAAMKSGLSERTLYRFLDDADFKREYLAARREAFENSIGLIQAATRKAVETLEKNLSCGSPSVEVRSAQIILENAYKGVEMLELVGRLEKIEDAIEKQNNEGGKKSKSQF